MTLPPILPQLVQRFRDNLSDYRSGKYNETQVRREFLDPLFEALGWDVNNTQGYAEAYKDVIHEDAVKVAGATKAPDYGFRIGGTRKFFVEAKKPSVNVKDEISPAFQFFTQFIEQLPIRPIHFSDPAEVARHDRMVALVQSMLDLHQCLAAANTPTEKTVVARQIKTTDQQIDRLVYALYGLTEEEIQIVEG